MLKLFCPGKLLLMAGMLALPLSVKAVLQGDFDPKTICPSAEVVTPHVKWLKPSAEGPLKTLFIIAQDRMREIIELAQRMDLDYQVVVAGNKKLNLPPLQYEDMQKDFQEKINAPLDLIVVSLPEWKALSYMQRYHILRKVKDGVPLLTFAAGADEYLNKASAKKAKGECRYLVPWKGLPAFTNFAGTAEFQAGTMETAVFGKGTIYLLKGYETIAPQALTPPRTMDDPLDFRPAEYDYYLGMIIHIMRSTAKKTPTIEVKADDYLRVSRDNPISVNFSVKSPNTRAAIMRFALRTPHGKLVLSRRQTMKLIAGENKVTFKINEGHTQNAGGIKAVLRRLVAPDEHPDSGWRRSLGRFLADAPAHIPAGNYFADLWIQDGQKILEFGSVYIEANGSNELVNMEVKPAIHAAEGVSGKIFLKTDPKAEGLILKVRQRDNFGRITAETSLPITGAMAEKQEAPFTLPPTTPLTIIQYIDAELCRRAEVLARQSKALSVCELPGKNDDISFVVWAGVGQKGADDSSYLSPYFFKNLHDAGFDTQYTTFSPSAPLANLRHIPYATRLLDEQQEWHPNQPRKAPHVREPCLTGPEYRKKEQTKLTKAAEKLRPFGTAVFSLGDECFFVGGVKLELCFSPTCIAAFHEFLKKEYGTIDDLNREYGSAFKSFAEIKPITLDEARKEPRLMPLWVDFRRHMESTWAGMLAFDRDVVRAIVLNARVGYEGSDSTLINSFQAIDWQKIMSEIQLNNTYDGTFVPYAVVDLSQPGTMLGTGWYGGYEEYKKYNDWDSRAFNQYISWRHLFRGANSFWVWPATIRNAGYGHDSITAPDFSILECFVPNLAEVREIKSGAGKLLMNARRESDRTAILYSAASVHAATLSESGGTMQAVLNNIVPLMEDTRRQFRIISYSQLAEGILEKEGYGFLILPYAQALSKKEAENIRSFVRNGGTVLADVRPGVCDEHGKSQEKGMLDDVFGVTQNTCVTQKLARVAVIFNDNSIASNLNTLADSTLKLQTGQAGAKAGDAPALTVNEHGRGKAILMNFTLHEYQNNADALCIEVERPTKQAPEIRKVFEHVLTLAGLGPKIKIAPDVPGLRAYRYQAGGLHYIGFLQHPCRARTAQFGEIENYGLFNRTQIPSPVMATATLDGKYHVYDVRRGKRLGYTDTIPMEIGPGRAEFFSLLPYEVKGVQIKTADCVKQGETLAWSAQLQTETGKAGLHTFRIMLLAPDGKGKEYYADNIQAEDGKASGKINLAFNDAPGMWTLRIKDTASGRTAEAAFKLKRLEKKAKN